MTSMQLSWTDVVAMTLAAAVALPLAIGTPAVAATPAPAVSEAMARDEAALYLPSAPHEAKLVADRWEVSDGSDTAWLDARTGELVEIEFAAP